MTLPNRLFWDVNPQTLDYNKHARFIIQRVIQRGAMNDWIKIREVYSLDRIKSEILMMRSLDNKTLTFFSTYFGINKQDFRCFTTQQSTPKHFNY